MHATIQDLLDSRPSHFIPFLSTRPSGMPLVYFIGVPPTELFYVQQGVQTSYRENCCHLFSRPSLSTSFGQSVSALISVQILSSVHHTSLLHHIWINNMDVQPSLFWLLCFSICTLWIIDITVFPVLML